MLKQNYLRIYKGFKDFDIMLVRYQIFGEKDKVKLKNVPNCHNNNKQATFVKLCAIILTFWQIIGTSFMPLVDA